jgi:hypothetical protein
VQATAAARAELQRATVDGLRGLTTANANDVHTTNGWQVNLDLGTDASKLTVRQQAGVARYSWGPVPAVEAVYPRLVTASDGRPPDGSKRYGIHFARGATPPVDAFWSYTVYGPDMYLVPNSQNRYSISGDTPGLTKNADGSIDLSLQHDPPAGHEANWLPVPSGPFHVIMRCYLPRGAILDGTYEYPPLRVIS